MTRATYVGPKSFLRYLGRAAKPAPRRRGMAASLMLTPMVDMFSLLVIFLLQVFSASPETIVTPNLVLPQASSGTEMKDAPVLALGPAEAFLDQKSLGSVDKLARDPSPLLQKLGLLRREWLRQHPGRAFPGEISLQAHALLPSTTVSRIMAVLPSAQYGTVQLVALDGGGVR